MLFGMIRHDEGERRRKERGGHFQGNRIIESRQTEERRKDVEHIKETCNIEIKENKGLCSPCRGAASEPFQNANI